MHGWISLPVWCYPALLVLAVVLGLRLGSAPVRRNGVVLWLAFSVVYAFFVLLVAFGYELLRHPGDYDIAAWAFLFLPMLVCVLPTIGAAWLLASRLRREHAVPSAADYRVKLLAASATTVALGALVLFGWQPSVRQRWMHFVTAPRDLTPITGGSDWTCLPGRTHGPSIVGVLDLHFSALERKRWQSFQHEGPERPYFDLEHAMDKELFSAGSYEVESGKITLNYEVWGNKPGRAGRSTASSAADSDASAVRGAIVLEKVAEPMVETLSLRSLSSDAMTLVAQYGNASASAFPLSCRRLHDQAFRDVRLLDCGEANNTACPPNAR